MFYGFFCYDKKALDLASVALLECIVQQYLACVKLHVPMADLAASNCRGVGSAFQAAAVEWRNKGKDPRWRSGNIGRVRKTHFKGAVSRKIFKKM